jgi:molybdopterin/thiamine biosynthesis adenylyltransferase
MVDLDLDEACGRAAEENRFPDGEAFFRLRTVDSQLIADAAGCPVRDVDNAALSRGILPERYERNFKALSPEEQAKLLASKVAVVGLGGLGGTVVEILARLGVGYLRLVDGDRFEGHNLNRQFLSSMAAIGQPKADAARDRIASINPSVVCDARRMFMTPENADDLVQDVHLVVDCLDTISARFDLEAACRQCGVPLVSGAIAGASGHVTVVFPDDSGLRRIYGDPRSASARGAEATLGTLPMAASLAASLEATETIKILLKRDLVLRHRLLIFDLMAGLFETVSLADTD